MITKIIKGRITVDGRIEAELPDGWQVGDVLIEVPIKQEIWTDEEIEELMQSDPQSGAEIAAADEIGAWSDRGIEDSVAFVEEMRRKRRERRQW
ncbi:MAG: hypothetical protein Q9P01_11005 [Anaerolineae bacterium]|nr:hypothetical protein [Anaerolineae bacterium]MDQ7035333.1 hypothetical protein [Anaerolineae bacterium]